MALLFLVLGLVLILTIVQGRLFSFAGRFWGDITSAGFAKWLVAILIIGLLGYIPGLRSPSRYLLGLVAIVILLTGGTGFISQFVSQIQNPGTAPTPAPAGGNPNLPAIPVQNVPTGGTNQPQSGASPGGLPGGLPGMPSLSSVLSIGRLFGL